MAEPEGFSAPVTPGLWRRITMYGIPYYWFGVWALLGILQVFFIVKWLKPSVGVINSVMPALILCGAELMVMQACTRKDVDWDNKVLRQLWHGWPRYLRGR